MKYDRTFLVDINAVPGVVMVRTEPTKFGTREYFFTRCGDVWLVWDEGRDPTRHAVEFAEKRLSGEVRTKHVSSGQTSLADFTEDEEQRVDEKRVAAAD